jgi:quercetin dioxygenase-like cupin family protein
MNDEVIQVAARLRDAREIAGLSVAALATQLDIPFDVYTSYETGNTDIPISILYKAAAVIGLDLSALLTGEEPRLHTYSLVRKGRGVTVDRHPAYRHEHLAPNFRHRKAEPFLVTVEPVPADGPLPLNTHPGQEFNYILQGTLRVTVAGHDLELGPGDTLFFDASLPHGMAALGDTAATFLALIF